MSQIENYKDAILSLASGSLSKEHLFVKDFLLQEKGDLSIYYVPYDYVNEQAKVMIVGITPGFTQMQLAFRSARADLIAGVSPWQIDKNAKKLASFAGSMRKNLIEMLNDIGLPGAIGIDNSGALFEERRDLLHTTSVIRYPVFRKGKNYTGHNPAILKSETLYHYAESILLPELTAVKDALVIPLGKSVSEVIRAFAHKGWVNEERCLFDMPHPSGANGHRIKQFEQSKAKLKQQIEAWFS
ncbi:uracil-DNA glycosylase family protein [Paenibacillus prosopidis]|uniref:Uracil DNA glycosylase superfamily protein n=1 Tax=Paenibacillus prosopidis TaxID=630520 RepID=A0A368VLT6_9BACL|nr:uracil-DNA glycosylase family protein [Paenibacillus prosopidis]RCW42498.1 uracil DNA glycosylase superfamily protein [Paenibacillus prosopidis]